MSTYFTVYPTRLKHDAEELEAIRKAIENAAGRANNVSRRLNGSVARVKGVLNQETGKLEAQSSRASKASHILSDISGAYSSTDKEIAGNAEDMNQSDSQGNTNINTSEANFRDILKKIISFIPFRTDFFGPEVIIPVLPTSIWPHILLLIDQGIDVATDSNGWTTGYQENKKENNEIKGDIDMVDVAKHDSDYTGDKNTADKIDDFNHDNKIFDKKHQGYLDKEGYHVVDQNNDAQKDAFKDTSGTNNKIPWDINFYDIGDGDSIAWKHKDNKANDENIIKVRGKEIGRHDTSVDIGKAEYNYGASAGTGGVRASAGAGATAYTNKQKSYLGNDYFDVHESTEVNAGKADANAEIGFGFLDKDGKINPNVYAGIKGEALAGEAKGEAGVKVAGTEVNVEGGVNFGIGAHAEGGIKDGKITVDAGVSLGPGVSVKIEVDASDTIEWVADNAENIKDGFAEAGETVSYVWNEYIKWW